MVIDRGEQPPFALFRIATRFNKHRLGHPVTKARIPRLSVARLVVKMRDLVKEPTVTFRAF